MNLIFLWTIERKILDKGEKKMVNRLNEEH